jgi:hypothetical protein
LREPRNGLSQDYRRMVEAIQSGDLVTARKAHGRMVERLSGNGTGADGALGKIGVSLRRGDLAAANRTLEALESRALHVLRALREHIEMAPSAIGTSLRKPN